MNIKTTLTIDKTLLGQIKNIAFENNLNQSQVLAQYAKYCIENNVEVKPENEM